MSDGFGFRAAGMGYHISAFDSDIPLITILLAIAASDAGAAILFLFSNIRKGLQDLDDTCREHIYYPRIGSTSPK